MMIQDSTGDCEKRLRKRTSSAVSDVPSIGSRQMFGQIVATQPARQLAPSYGRPIGTATYFRVATAPRNIEKKK